MLVYVGACFLYFVCWCLFLFVLADRCIECNHWVDELSYTRVERATMKQNETNGG